ncbi:unnamed protein product, partial [marine sediment metagenome]
PYDIKIALEKAKEALLDKFEPREITINHNLKTKKYFTLGNELLKDAFFNILDNAVMYDRSDEIIIEINISTSDDFDGFWRIEFMDQGKREVLKRFNPDFIINHVRDLPMLLRRLEKKSLLSY